jgi:hypothetical protein
MLHPLRARSGGLRLSFAACAARVHRGASGLQSPCGQPSPRGGVGEAASVPFPAGAAAAAPLPPLLASLRASASRVRTQASALAWLSSAADSMGWSRGAAAWVAHASARRAGERAASSGAPAPSPAPALPAGAAAALRAPLCGLLRGFARLPAGGAGAGGGGPSRPPLSALFAGARLLRAVLPAGVRWRYQHPFRAEAAALQHAVIGGDAELRGWGAAAAAAAAAARPPAPARLDALVDLLCAVADIAHFTPAVGVSLQAIDAALIVCVREGALADAPPAGAAATAHAIFAAHEVLGISCPALWFALGPALLRLLRPGRGGWLAGGGAADGDALARLAALAYAASRVGGLEPAFLAALLRALPPRLAAAAAAGAGAAGAAALASAARRAAQTLVADGVPVGALPPAELAAVLAATAAACEAQTAARAGAGARAAAAERAAAERGGGGALGGGVEPPPRVGGVVVLAPSRGAREAAALIHALCASGAPLPVPALTAAARAALVAELAPYARWAPADVRALAARRDAPSAALLRALQTAHQLVLWAAAEAPAAPRAAAGAAPLLPAWLPPLTAEAVVAAAGAGGGGPRSAYEALVTRLVAAACARRGLPPPVASHVADFGLTVDMAWPAVRVAVEADGPYHFAPRPPAEHAAVLAAARGGAWDAGAPEAAAWLVARSPRGPCELWHVTSTTHHPRMLLRQRALAARGWLVARVAHHHLYPQAGGAGAGAAAPAAAPAPAPAPAASRDDKRGPFRGAAAAPPPPRAAMLAHEDDGLATVDRLLDAAGVWRRLEAAAAAGAALPSLRAPPPPSV